MSANDRMKRLIPVILRRIADELERNPELAERIIGSVGRTRTVVPPVDFDPFEVLRSGGETALREALNRMDVDALKAIITQHGLDTTRLAQKWRRKERLVDFIVERIVARARQGEVFRNPL